MILAQRLFGIWLLARGLPFLSETLDTQRSRYMHLPATSAILVTSALIPVIVGTYLWLRSRSIGRPTAGASDRLAGQPTRVLRCGLILIGVWLATRGSSNAVAGFSTLYPEPSFDLLGRNDSGWTSIEVVDMAYAVLQLLMGLTLIRLYARIAARLGFTAG